MLTAQLPKSYSPSDAEDEVRQRWDAAGAFHVDPTAGGEPYCIVIPPPNVTAALHLGHALNNTLQDILIRYHRMRGHSALWMPGTDHAGIATQTVVEKRLLQQGKRRADFSREAFVARIQQWKDDYEATITEQLKALGCSCDWDRQRFTMDPVCARAVREAFFRLFREGLIYRGKRLVNWDPATLTALADDEVEMQDVQGRMWYLRYPLTPGRLEGEETHEYVTVATTRPETMLGDAAVAINPKDPRAERYIGRHVRLPIVDRVVPIIGDDHVVMPGDADNPMAEYATGFLKVTPAHDPDDWEIGLRHQLPVINVMAPDATISADYGWKDIEEPSREAARYFGLSREEARDQVVEWFRKHGLLEEAREYRHSVGHSYRSHVPIEPYLSDQWYVKATDDRLVGEAQRALAPEQFEGTPPPRRDGPQRIDGDGELRFFPDRYAKMYQAWHENLRDWCISRQLWWGHRIPVWSLPSTTPLAGKTEYEDWVLEQIEAGRAAAIHRDPEEDHKFFRRGDDLHNFYLCLRDEPSEDDRRILERAGFERDPDVLDTWFSSALWPISTMGWPEPQAFPETLGLLERFNPSSVLCTGRDIITLWVSRMVMFNRYFRDGKLPFRHVYVNPMLQDGHGQLMSKSLGNGVDPRDIIHSHGADALRFVLCQIATSTQDVRMPVDLVCPRCGRTFRPQETVTPAGYRVAAPRQQCPATGCGQKMTSSYGESSGLATATAELPLARNTSSKFDPGRNFANKLFNATRFALKSIDETGAAPARSSDGKPPRADDGPRLSLLDRWMLTRLYRTLRTVEEAIAHYQFSRYAEAMYDLIWRDFCDWYLEAVKPTIRDDPHQQRVLRTALGAMVRMLHPICPFVTEALWPHIQAAGDVGLPGVTLGASDDLATAAWPEIDHRVEDRAAADTFERIQDLTNTIRRLRAEHQVPPRTPIRLLATPGVLELIEAGGLTVQTLARLRSVERLEAAPQGAVAFGFEGESQALDFAGEVDAGAQRDRLHRQLADLQKQHRVLSGRLNTPGYVDNAPADLVDETRSRLATVESDIAAARQAIESSGHSDDPQASGST